MILKKVVGMINGVPLTQEDINWSRKFIRKYKAAEKKYRSLAKKANDPRRRAGYLRQAQWNAEQVIHSQRNLDAQLARVNKWLD